MAHGPQSNGNSSIEEQAVLVDKLQSPGGHNPYIAKSGCETWSCAWSPDGSYFAWSCGYRIVKLIPWNRFKNTLQSKNDKDEEGEKLEQKVVTIDTGELVWAVAFGSATADTHKGSTVLNWWRYKHLDDLILATGLQSGRIRTWCIKTGQLLLELLDHKEVIRDLKFAPDGSLRLASASRDGKLKLWDLKDDGNMYKTIQGTSKWVFACAWSPDAKIMAVVGDSRSAVLWDVVKFKRIMKLEGHQHDVVDCDFSPDGALLATASYDTKVILWDTYTGNQISCFGHLDPPPSFIFAGGANGAYVRSVSFSHDGQHLATVCDDVLMRFWHIFDTSAPQQVSNLPDALCCSYSPDGSVIATGTREGSVNFYLAPMEVADLQHLCRLAIRRVLPTPKVDNLQLPQSMKYYLKYQD